MTEDPASATRQFDQPPTLGSIGVEPTEPGEKSSTDLDVGAEVGRYVVLRRIAAGGMGVVFAAWDPELDRKVALKLLKVRDATDLETSRGEAARLVRESRAMAKLSHPNVVAIYDVGTFAGGVFMAMELVEGRTLRQWMDEKPRTWREVVEVMLPAGRGLVAAHEAGLVHRDFKPTNVLVSQEGRVYVTDFGLARPTVREDSLEGPSRHGVDLLVSSAGARFEATGDVTQFGTVVGTPAFMAPEQRSGGQLDARTDQFSFCVSLYYALYGVLPFRKHARHAALDYSRVREAPADTSVPTWLRKVVLRGLSVRPEDRHPSMGALFSALSRDPARTRRRWAAGVAGIGIVLVGAWAYARAMAPSVACEDEDPRLAAVWTEDQHAAAQAAFEGTGRAFASEAWVHIEGGMSDFTRQWSAARRESCEATHVRREQSEDVLDRRMWCLSRALEDGRAVSELLATADLQVISRWVETLQRLPAPASCLDVEALMHDATPPPVGETRDAVEGVRHDLANVAALEAVGRMGPAVELAEDVMTRADAIAWTPLQAQSAMQLGRLRLERGEFDQTQAALTRAFNFAERSQMDSLKADVSHMLARLALDRSQPDVARLWIDLAAATLERAGGGLELQRATQAESRGELARTEDDLPRALSLQREALELKLHAAPNSPNVAASYHNIATILAAMGDETQAIEYQRRAFELFERVYGSGHPNLGHMALSLGLKLAMAGSHEEALQFTQRAIDVFSASLGDTHLATGAAREAMAMNLFRVSRFADGQVFIDRVRHDAQGDTPAHVRLLGELDYAQGWIALGRGDFELAHAAFQRAYDTTERLDGSDKEYLAARLDGLGEALVALDRPSEAIDMYLRAIELTRPTAPEGYSMGYHRMGLGFAQLAHGDAGSAADNLAEALRMLQARISDGTVLGRTRGALAQALWDAPGRRADAVKLVAQAKEDLARAGGRERRDLARLIAWLDAR